MVPRDTRTGRVLEEMVLPALKRGGYECREQSTIGRRPGGRPHKVDIAARSSGGEGILVSLKWQQVSGTTEQKVPFEVICLAHALRVRSGDFARAYVVLGGDGWTLRDFYVGGGLREYLRGIEDIEILTLEQFIARANNAQL